MRGNRDGRKRDSLRGDSRVRPSWTAEGQARGGRVLHRAPGERPRELSAHAEGPRSCDAVRAEDRSSLRLASRRCLAQGTSIPRHGSPDHQPRSSTGGRPWFPSRFCSFLSPRPHGGRRCALEGPIIPPPRDGGEAASRLFGNGAGRQTVRATSERYFRMISWIRSNSSAEKKSMLILPFPFFSRIRTRVPSLSLKRSSRLTR